MIKINYQKRKNAELFKTLECYDFKNTQNYIPIYNRFFSLNETNFNNVNLNHEWYLTNIKENVEENKNLYNCYLKNQTTQKTKTKQVFFKLAPLVDPFKYLIGKYNPKDEKLYRLPFLTSGLEDFNVKFTEPNNSSYVDSFFSFLNSKLIHDYGFIHGVDFYGSYLSIKNNFTINIFDDLDYLNKSDYFNKNKNVLFYVDDYDFLFNDDDDEKQKLPLIKIDRTTSSISNISINSINDSMYDDVFSNEIVSLDNLKDRSLDIVDINNLEIQTNITTTLKSGSTCSSRSSYTEENDNDDLCCKKDETEESERDKYDSGSESNSDYNSDDSGNEERINVIIPHFPVQIISMEKCESTFDDLILNEELSEVEWYSAFMQIIMILITYQKMFAFTHNDLHTNNVMYNKTDAEFVYYCFKKKYYKVPTFGRIFKIIDFGRSIYKFDGKLLCSDSFKNGEDAATQYNTEPYFNDKKPRLEPNYSFDIVDWRVLFLTIWLKTWNL